LGLLEIAEKKYDTVLMNPPFGEPTAAGKKSRNIHLKSCDDDLGAAFMHAAAVRWAQGGNVGVVSSSTLWFKHTLADWRQEVLLNENSAIVLGAHLGGHVLDNASVGAVATVIGHAKADSAATFFRCLRSTDKAAALRESLRAVNAGDVRPPAYLVALVELRAYRKSPLVYWISRALRADLTRFPALEGTGADVRQGVACADDPRFVRAWWEIPADQVGPTRGWLPFAKSSEYSPFWDDITWVIRWARDGAEVRAFDKSRPQNIQYFGRPGVTFPARAVLGFNPRAFPAAIGFGHMGSVAFPRDTTAATLLGYLASRPAEYVLSFSNGSIQGKKGAYQNHYEVGQIGDLPWPGFTPEDARRVGDLGAEMASAAMRLLRDDETTHQFAPSKVLHRAATLDEVISAAIAEDARLVADVAARRAELDAIVARALGFKPQDVEAMREEFAECEAPTSGPWCSTSSVVDAETRGAAARSLISYAVGIALRRFDASAFAATSTMPLPGPLDPFSASPPVLAVPRPSTAPFLVIDRADPDLAEQSVLAALQTCWPAAGPHATAELSSALGVDRIGEYVALVGATGFYDDHVSRYSKGRRRAPAYFWLGTSSGSFGVLVVAATARADLLFVLRNDVVKPRLTRAERSATEARDRDFEGSTAATRAEIAAADGLVDELRALAVELERCALLWNPAVDDGVVVNAAPLHRLMPHRQSRSKAEESWRELVAGEYDWSHLAMHLWPERVVPKCATDRSFAIAHGLEDVFWLEDANGKWKPRATPTRPLADLIAERTSAAVAAARDSLINAPTPGGGGASKKKRAAPKARRPRR
jgi:hypothetical protein